MVAKKIKVLENEEYHAMPEYSSSQLKVAIQDIALFEQKYILKTIPPVAKKAFLIGTLFHEMVLEPEMFSPIVYPYEQMDKRIKKYKEFLAENPDIPPDEIISQQDNDNLKTMYRSIMDYPQAAELLDIKEEGSENEISVFFQYSGFDLRIRPDRWRGEVREIVDLKTTAKPMGYQDFLRLVNKMDYDLSAAMYVTGMKALTGEDHAFTWVVTQSVAPFSTAVYHMDESVYRSGMSKLDEALGALSYAKSEGYKVQHKPQILSYKSNNNEVTGKLRFGTGS